MTTTTSRNVDVTNVERWDDDDDFDFSSLSSSSAVLTRASQEDSASATDSSHDGDESGGVVEAKWPDALHKESEMFYDGREDRFDDEEDEQGDTLKVSDLNEETLAKLASYAKKPTEKIATNKSDGNAHIEREEDHEAWDRDVIVPEQLSMDSLKRGITADGDTTDFFTLRSHLSDTSSASFVLPHRESSPYHLKETTSPSTADVALESESFERYDDFDFDEVGKDIAQELRTRLCLKKTDMRSAAKVSSAREREGSVEPESGLVVTDDLDISPGRLRARALSSKLREAAQKRKQQPKDKQRSGPPPSASTGQAGTSSRIDKRVGQVAPSPTPRRVLAQSRDREIGQDVAKTGSEFPLTRSMTAGRNRWRRGANQKSTYGSGHELDTIKDLPVVEREKPENELGTAQPVQTASLSSSTRRKRQRKKKEPYLIRNLGSSGNGSMQVGDMKWNPVLKRWEGNEQEGREFENAVRGSGRPALITRLSLGSSGIALGGLIADAGVLTKDERTASKVTTTKANLGVAHVVGDMVFDPINLCWKRNDGIEEADPFADMDEADDDDDGRRKRYSAARKMRQRTVSAEDLALMSDVSLERDTKNNAELLAMIRTSFDRRKGYATLSRPLQECIDQPLWKASLEAEQRHQRQMTAFAGLLRTNARRPMHAKSHLARHRNEEHLYSIRTLARQTSKGL